MYQVLDLLENRLFHTVLRQRILAEVAELAYAHALGACARKGLRVQIPLSAPNEKTVTILRMKFTHCLLSVVITLGVFFSQSTSAAFLDADSQEYSLEENGLITSVVPLFYRKIKVFYEDGSHQIVDTLETQGKTKLLLKVTNDHLYIIAVNPTGSEVSLLNGYTGEEIQKVSTRPSGQAGVKIRRFVYSNMDFFLLTTTKNFNLHATLFQIEPAGLTDVGSQLYLKNLPSNTFQLERVKNKFTVKQKGETQGKFKVDTSEQLTCTSTQSECTVYFWEV